jgi:hypothetical protein
VHHWVLKLAIVGLLTLSIQGQEARPSGGQTAEPAATNECGVSVNQKLKETAQSLIQGNVFVRKIQADTIDALKQAARYGAAAAVCKSLPGLVVEFRYLVRVRDASAYNHDPVGEYKTVILVSAGIDEAEWLKRGMVSAFDSGRFSKGQGSVLFWLPERGEGDKRPSLIEVNIWYLER